MKLDCPREQDVLDAAAAGRWPHRADAELRDHASICPICHDVAAIAVAFLEERELSWNDGDVPPASLVWWRSQIRAREEASRAVNRPIALAQGIAVALLVFVALLLIPYSVSWVAAMGEAAKSVFAWVTPRAADLSAAWEFTAGKPIPLFALTATALLAPVVVYLALADE
jgi:hypothetical protein